MNIISVIKFTLTEGKSYFHIEHTISVTYTTNRTCPLGKQLLV